MDDLAGGVDQVLIAFRLQSEFGPKSTQPKTTQPKTVLIAFRLQSEFGPVADGELIYKGAKWES